MCVAVLAAVFMVVAENCTQYGDYGYGYDDGEEDVDFIYPQQPCPSMCDCDICPLTVVVDCEARNLTRVPVNLSDFTSSL